MWTTHSNVTWDIPYDADLVKLILKRMDEFLKMCEENTVPKRKAQDPKLDNAIYSLRQKIKIAQ